MLVSYKSFTNIKDRELTRIFAGKRFKGGNLLFVCAVISTTLQNLEIYPIWFDITFTALFRICLKTQEYAHAHKRIRRKRKYILMRVIFFFVNLVCLVGKNRKK